MKVFIIVNIIIASLMYLENYSSGSYTFGMKIWLTAQLYFLALEMMSTRRILLPIILLLGIDIIMNLIVMPILDILLQFIKQKVRLKEGGMIKRIKSFLKNKIVEKRRSSVTDIKLREIILKSNKNEVVSCALNYIQEKEYYELINTLIGAPDNYLSPINNEEYLCKTFERIYSVAERVYKNKEVENYEIRVGFAENSFGGFPFDFGEFIDIVYTDDNYECTDKFVFIDDTRNVLPIEFMINCKLSKCCLEYKTTKIVALALLQIIYIEEINKQCV